MPTETDSERFYQQSMAETNKAWEMGNLLKRLREGGRIVAETECTEVEKAEANHSQRFYEDTDGFRYIYMFDNPKG